MNMYKYLFFKCIFINTIEVNKKKCLNPFFIFFPFAAQFEDNIYFDYIDMTPEYNHVFIVKI